MPTLPFLIISLTPSSQKRSKKRPTYQYTTWCQGLGEAHIASLALHSAPPYQWVTVTMETNKFLHITGEPACQQPRALGEAEGSLQQEGLARFTEDCGELMGD